MIIKSKCGMCSTSYYAGRLPKPRPSYFKNYSETPPSGILVEI